MLGVEGRVEAGHCREAGQRPADGIEGGQGLRLVERRQVSERAQLAHDTLVDDHGLDELRATVHDAVADGVDPAEAAPARPSAAAPHRPARAARAGRAAASTRSVGVEQAQLQAARAGVDHQDLRIGTARVTAPTAGQVQSRTSGASSPCSRV